MAVSRADDPGGEVPLTGRVAIAEWVTCRVRLGRLWRALALGACLGLAIATRLVGLDLASTADEALWMQRTLAFAAALERGDLNSTYRIGHPGVTVMWTGLAGIGRDRARTLSAERYQGHYVLERAPSYLALFSSARTAIAVAASVLLTVAIGLAWLLLGAGPALVGGLLLIFDPFTTGMTRLLHVDALLGPLMSVAVLAGLVHNRAHQRRYLVLSAVATGLALLTKPPAVVVGMMFVGMCAVTVWRFPQRRRVVLADVALWAALVVLTFVVCWPVLWVEPLHTLNAMVAFIRAQGAQPHPGGVFFLGRTVTQDPGPLFYPIAALYRFGLIPLIGLAFLPDLRRSDRLFFPSLALATYVLLFVAVMSLGAKKLDRYLLPALIVATLLAGVGFWSLARWTGRAGPVIIAGCLGVQLWLFVVAQPYPIAAYNPLINRDESVTRVMTVGWGEGLDQVVDYLNARSRPDRLVVASNYPHVVRPSFRGTTHSLTRLPPPVIHVDYVVVYVSSVQRDNLSSWAREVVNARPPVFVARVHGVPYALVFRVPPELERPTAPMPNEDVSDDDEETDGDR